MPDDKESGTYEISRGPLVIEVEHACNDVDLALAEAAVCLDFLAELTGGELARAVGDTQTALQRIGAAVDRLRHRCSRVARRAGSDAVGQRSAR